MTPAQFIDNYREAFGEAAPLPIAFGYADEAIAVTPKTAHCFFREVIPAVRAGQSASLNADNISCGGGRFYTGFAPMGKNTPTFVSLTERYKATPEMVVDFVERSGVGVATRKWLNLARVDTLESFDDVEGIVFFATPDILSGLAAWAWFDNNDEGAVTTRFGSGCSTIIADPVRENRRQVESHRVCSNGRDANRRQAESNQVYLDCRGAKEENEVKEENERSEVNRVGGKRTFIGCMDISVRPLLAPGELSFAIPMSRFREMLTTMRCTALFAGHAWPKVKDRIL